MDWMENGEQEEEGAEQDESIFDNKRISDVRDDGERIENVDDSDGDDDGIPAIPTFNLSSSPLEENTESTSAIGENDQATLAAKSSLHALSSSISSSSSVRRQSVLNHNQTTSRSSTDPSGFTSSSSSSSSSSTSSDVATPADIQSILSHILHSNETILKADEADIKLHSGEKATKRKYRVNRKSTVMKSDQQLVVEFWLLVAKGTGRRIKP